MHRNMPGIGTNLPHRYNPFREIQHLFSQLSKVDPNRTFLSLSFFFTHHTVTICLSLTPAYIQRIVPYTVKSRWPSIFSRVEISSMPRQLHTLQHLQTITDYASVNQEVTREASKVLPGLNTNGEHQKSTPKARSVRRGSNEAASRQDDCLLHADSHSPDSLQ